MTNAVPVFRETLEDFKLCYDKSLMSGVIHPVVHGFNYNPPEAGFPGWVRFGSYLNEQNPWWPHFRRWSRLRGAPLLRPSPERSSRRPSPYSGRGPTSGRGTSCSTSRFPKSPGPGTTTISGSRSTSSGFPRIS